MGGARSSFGVPIGGHLPNCGLQERNAAGGMAPQPVGERSLNLATYTAQ
jgi:hypothetical protein